MRGIIAALGLSLAAAMIAAPAHADSADAQYLALLSSHGIKGAPDQLIADAHETCDAFGQGGFGIGISPRGFALLRLNGDLGAQGFSPHDTTQVMMDATRIYCPQFAPPA